MKWIGLTGGIACGKTTVTEILKSMGHHVISADNIVHQLTEAGSEACREIQNHFGDGYFDAQGNLDRRRLGSRVFSQPKDRELLEAILHPKVRLWVEQERKHLEKLGTVPEVFYEVPLLFEKQVESEFDEIVVVACPEEAQRERLKKRHSLSDSEVTARLAAQLPQQHKVEGADYVIHNAGGPRELEQAVKEFLREYQARQAKTPSRT